MGEAVLSMLAEDGAGHLEFRHLAVRGMPGSGKPEELMDAAGISASHIVDAARDLVAGQGQAIRRRHN